MLYIAKGTALAATLLVLAGHGLASPALAESPGTAHRSWYDSYADDAVAKPRKPKDRTIIIIENGSKQHVHRHGWKRHPRSVQDGRPVLGQQRAWRGQPTGRIRSHASGYSW